ncbi:MAG: DNA-processing protein DprA, partial [Paludibacteraceae bacterium]|nr:DNA-processing protein DprA [Paludibacteraceae bacterium]
MDECLRKAEQEIAWIEDHRIRVWTQSDEDYPYRLKQCPDRPFLLFGKGNMDLSEGHLVSIVGTRRPTPYGMEMTEKLVRELHERLDKLTIISGGAYGIDICAHRAAIKYGVPTIIVPAHGLDRIYPSVHRPEAIASMEKGGLLTEFMSGTEPIAPHFVQRNRIVAGLADAVVVVESKEKGGSLITASMACDYDRDLFAFPGRPMDVLASGCNKLIRDNKAQLITSADDLIHAMKWDEDNNRQPIQTQMVEFLDDLTLNQQTIMQLLQTAEEGMHINLIVMETQMTYGDVAAEMVMLEVQGLVKAYPGGIYRVVR